MRMLEQHQVICRTPRYHLCLKLFLQLESFCIANATEPAYL